MIAALKLRPFRPDDLLSVPLPPSVPTPSHLPRLHWRRQLAGESSWTAENAAGRIVACAGTSRLRCGIVRAWVFFSVDSGPCLVPLWRMQRNSLRDFPGCLVLAWVDENWKPSVRWAQLLGFVPTDKRVCVGGQVLTLYGHAVSSTTIRRSA